MVVEMNHNILVPLSNTHEGIIGTGNGRACKFFLVPFGQDEEAAVLEDDTFRLLGVGVTVIMKIIMEGLSVVATQRKAFTNTVIVPGLDCSG